MAMQQAKRGKASRMEPRHRDIIRRKRSLIVQDLDVRDIMDHMIQERVLNDSMKEEILSHKSRAEQVRAFLDKLPARGKHAFAAFMTALQEDYEHLADEMKEMEQEATSSTVENWRVTCAEHYVRYRSKMQLIPWDEDSPLTDIDDVYTTLSWLESINKPAVTRKVHLHSYLQIFKKIKGLHPKRILAQGRAGTGKSTFVSKMAVDWAKLVLSEGNYEDNDQESGIIDDYFVSHLKDILDRFELVLVVNLREVTEGMTLMDSVFQQIPSLQENEKQQMWNYIKQNQNKMLLIFDGYDEYDVGASGEVTDVIDNKSLLDCCVVVTTRPWKACEIKNKKRIDTHVEVVGFSEDNVRSYVYKFFKDDDEGTNKSQLLMRAIEMQNLWSLATIPLVALFLCVLWREEDKLPSSMTELYTEIVKFILGCYKAKGMTEEDEDYDDGAIDIDEFSQNLMELGQVALEGLTRENGLIFDYKHVKKILSEETWKLGFLSKMKSASTLKAKAPQVMFHHKSIQEYLAGFYAAKKLNDQHKEGQQFLNYLDSVERLYDCQLVIEFVCGLSTTAANQLLTHAIKVAGDDRNIVADHLKPGPVWIGTFQPHYFKHANRFTQFLFTCIQECSNKDKVKIKARELVTKVNSGNIQYLPKILRDSKQDNGSSVKMLCLCDLKEPGQKNKFVMDSMSVCKYVNPAATPQLQSFCLSFVDCQPGIADLSAHIKKMTNLTSLCLSEANLDQENMKCLFGALEHTLFVKYVNLSGNLVMDSVDDFAKVLPKLKDLRALVLIRAGLNPNTVGRLCGALRSLSCLEILDLSRNHIGSGTCAVSELLEILPKLWRLKMQDCAITGDNLEVLASKLPAAISLKELYLSWNQFGSKTTCLIHYFSRIKNLEKLHLLGIHMSESEENQLHCAKKTHLPRLKLFISTPLGSRKQSYHSLTLNLPVSETKLRERNVSLSCTCRHCTMRRCHSGSQAARYKFLDVKPVNCNSYICSIRRCHSTCQLPQTTSILGIVTKDPPIINSI